MRIPADIELDIAKPKGEDAMHLQVYWEGKITSGVGDRYH